MRYCLLVELWVIDHRTRILSAVIQSTRKKIQDGARVVDLFILLFSVHSAVHGYSCVFGVFIWNSESVSSHFI